MDKKIYSRKLWLIVGLCFMLVFPYSNTFARSIAVSKKHDSSRHEKSDRHSHEVVKFGHHSYHYHDGRFYRPGWFWFEFALSVPPIGAVVTYLPFGYKTVIVGGLPYYYYNNIYYRPCPSGYVVVPEPIASSNVVYVPESTQLQNSSRNTFVINVPNANGSFTPVTLVKSNNGYIGPQGEYYPGNPTIDDLRVLYGK